MKTIITKTKYRLKIREAAPLLFQELRIKHNMARPFFRYKYTVPETGAELEFVYNPPDEEPNKEEDEEMWARHQMYLTWLADYQNDEAAYNKERNDLMLDYCVKIDRGPKNWKQTFESGSWRKTVENRLKVKVTPENEHIWFLKAVVLTDSSDYLNVLAAATAEEVTIGDVLKAYDYFRTVISRCPAFSDYTEIARWRDKISNVLLGGRDGVGNEDDVEQVVLAESDGEGVSDSGEVQE